MEGQAQDRGQQGFGARQRPGSAEALEDVGVRALASRYGNPTQILTRDYVTALPGVNAPGSYDEYARHPGAYWTKWAKDIEAGTYPFFKP